MTLSAILDTITRHADTMPEERVPLIDALGRRFRPLAARVDLPPFRRIVPRRICSQGAGDAIFAERLPRTLGPVPPGLKEGEALFVPTGGRFPRATRFVAREYATEKGQTVTIKDWKGKQKTVRKGDWVKKGQPLLRRGEVIGPAAMGLLAQGGHETIRVFGRPQVAVVATGDELKKGSIVDSNKFLLAGLIKRDGGETAGLYTTGDDEGEIAAAVAGASTARLVILTGGTALGKRDVTKQAVKRLGFRFLLDSAPILPGKTMAFGKKDKTCLFICPAGRRPCRPSTKFS